MSQSRLVMAEYVWIGASGTSGGFDLRCKTKTLPRKPASIADLPIWNYDQDSRDEESRVLQQTTAILSQDDSDKEDEVDTKEVRVSDMNDELVKTEEDKSKVTELQENSFKELKGRLLAPFRDFKVMVETSNMPLSSRPTA